MLECMRGFTALCASPGRSPAAFAVQCLFATLFYLLAQGTGTSVALEGKVETTAVAGGAAAALERLGGHWRMTVWFFSSSEHVLELRGSHRLVLAVWAELSSASHQRALIPTWGESWAPARH